MMSMALEKSYRLVGPRALHRILGLRIRARPLRASQQGRVPRPRRAGRVARERLREPLRHHGSARRDRRRRARLRADLAQWREWSAAPPPAAMAGASASRSRSAWCGRISASIGTELEIAILGETAQGDHRRGEPVRSAERAAAGGRADAPIPPSADPEGRSSGTSDCACPSPVARRVALAGFGFADSEHGTLSPFSNRVPQRASPIGASTRTRTGTPP